MIEDETQTNSFRMFSDLFTHVHIHCDTSVTSQAHTHMHASCHTELHMQTKEENKCNLGKFLNMENFVLFRH